MKHYVSLANQATESPLGHYRRNLRRSTSESPWSGFVLPSKAPDRTERTEVQVALAQLPSQNRQLDILPTLLDQLDKLGVHCITSSPTTLAAAILRYRSWHFLEKA